MFSNFLGISFKSWQILQFNAWTVETGVRLTQSRLIFCQMISYQGEMVVGIRSWSPTSTKLNSKMERKQFDSTIYNANIYKTFILLIQSPQFWLLHKFTVCLLKLLKDFSPNECAFYKEYLNCKLYNSSKVSRSFLLKHVMRLFLPINCNEDLLRKHLSLQESGIPCARRIR